MIRIIGGKHRGRMLATPEGEATRPTSNRARESLFNILMHASWRDDEDGGTSPLIEARVLDAYAGSGALGLEALSRGAARAVAVDRDPGLALALESNARAIGLDAIEVHRGDARRHLERETRDFDVIFADPPYGEDPWPWLLPACAARLSPGGVVYAEAGRALEAPEGLVLVRHGRAGQVHYHLYARC